MKQHSDKAIVLTRTNYGEKDRIVTFLCQKNGKITALAKSVRGQKSRLAGGVELFSIAEISFIEGKGDLKTLTGARLTRHFGSITKDLDKSGLAFEMLKILGKSMQQDHGQEYFYVLEKSLECLDDSSYDPQIIELWFGVQMLHRMGVFGEIKPDTIPVGVNRFNFDYSDHRFVANQPGMFDQNDLKLLHLALHGNAPIKLDGNRDLQKLTSLIRSLLKTSVFEV